MKITLIAIQDEINQYHEGNLTLEMCLNGIESLIKDLRNEQPR